MRSGRVSGTVAVVAATRAGARAAALELAPRLPNARLVPFSAASYLRQERLLPAILAAADRDRDRARRFLERARDRILWRAPSGDLYAAIAGFLTRLPPRRPGGREKDEVADAPALLLEGEIGTERVRAALSSTARHWIVENPGRVTLSSAELGRLDRNGVRWSALEPVTLVGIADATGAARTLFPEARIWRLKLRAPAPGRLEKRR